MITTKKLGDGSFHIQTDGVSTGLLSRYGIIEERITRSYAECSIETTDDGVLMHGAKRDVSVKIITNKKGGYMLQIPITEGERFFGIGDATRDGIMLRGKSVGIWVSNVTSYGPMPMLLSSDGWAIFVNSTFKQRFDIGDTDKNMLKITVLDDNPDFFLFTAKNLKDTLSALTDVTGKPMMLPSFGYGLTFIENELMTGERELIEDIIKMREKEIPCDLIGLEPSWMETYYDFSTEKKWNLNKFHVPTWRPENDSGPFSFFSTLRVLGMQLSLWLCEDYDLFYEEERQAKNNETDTDLVGDLWEEEFNKNLEFLDFHLTKKRYDLKDVTKIDEPWFEHLKKFVDNGAAGFKLDGSRQVLEHPQRAWAEKYLDKEAHNIYPTVLSKQMSNGFTDHTGRRSMINCGGAYVGIQKYAATWAGDTGGGPRTIVSALNYAMCGHTNTSCDMAVKDPLAIHYGFLMSWAQIDSWASYDLPWYLPKKNEALIKRYSQLRSTLFPYIYSMAHNASVTGIPIMRPILLEYENDTRFDDVTNAYMLGDSLYVGAFDMNLKLPEGVWIDYFTGKKYTGDFTYEIPEGYSGALFAKAGSIIGTMTVQQYINEREHDYIIKVFPGADASFNLYEDDGFTNDYKEGGFANTLFTLKDNGKSGAEITVNMREGSFEGRPDNGHNLYRNSIPEIKGIAPIRDMKISVYADSVKSVTLNGKAVDFTLENGFCEFTLPRDIHAKEVVKFNIQY